MNLIVIEKSGVVSSTSGDTRILYNGLPETLADGLRMAAGSRVLLKQGTNFELAATDGSVQTYNAETENEQTSGGDDAQAATDDIAALQQAIEEGQDPTQNQEAPAAGQPAGGSGSNGFITLGRTASETIATAGFDTTTFGDTLDFANEGGFAPSQRDANTDLIQSDNTPGPTPTGPTATLTGPTSIKEGETSTDFTVTLSQTAPVGSIVTLEYSYVGGADSSDIVQQATAEIGSDGLTATFTIAVNSDTLVEINEGFSVAVTGITDSQGADVFSTLNLNDASVLVGIEDDSDNQPDIVTVTLTGPDSVIEGETTSEYTITLSEPVPAGGIIATLTYQYINASGEDITEVIEVPFTAGSTTATFTIDTIDDVFAEPGLPPSSPGEKFVVLVSGITYKDTGDDVFEGLNLTDANQITAIIDEPTPDEVLVSMTGPDTVVEGETTTNYTVSIPETAQTDVTVNFTYTGTATDGTDYTSVGSITIPAGQTSQTFTISTLADTIVEDTEDFTITISSVSGGGFEAIGINTASDDVTTNITNSTIEPVLVSIEGPVLLLRVKPQLTTLLALLRLHSHQLPLPLPIQALQPMARTIRVSHPSSFLLVSKAQTSPLIR
ncbi:hypothetical protein CS022_14175 [Veronia nyctiphanis]|uniref:Calx-beta domain-containing protein n=1 Tax=Veronia nyctiphanis TaxID=1278244 RepID=A0A4Q0YQ99_9GAMM|nr:hypothetical protein CS022_14175 [Veronia nyctiphanis]